MTIEIRMTKGDFFWDMSLSESGDLDSDESFDSQLYYSILGERRASSSEVASSHLRRGWVGNEETGFENGSKVWMYRQSRLTRTNLNAIQNLSLEGLKWFVEKDLLVNVTSTATIKNGSTFLEIGLFRSPSKVDRRFFKLWDNTGDR